MNCKGAKKAFTLIEILIDLAIISVVAVAIVSAYFAAFRSIDLAKAKMVASTLANEKVEILRNMPYDDLVTQHGSIYPPGDIPDDEMIERNGVKYNVHTVISYIDDEFDGNYLGTVATKPKDLYPYDYKKIEITVGKFGKDSQLAKLVTNFAAKAAETPSNTGIMHLCVIDASGNPVSDANINITNNSISPVLSMSLTSGGDGCLMIPKLPPDEHNNYHVVVTKNGYSIAQTYPRTAQNPHALQPDVNIIIQQVTNLTLSIDRLSVMRLVFADEDGSLGSNLTFVLEGSKLIYNNPDTFKFSKSFTTDSMGIAEISDLEYDNYKIKNLSNGFVLTTNPMQAIELVPDTNLVVNIKTTSDSSKPTISNLSPIKGVVGDNISINIEGGNFNNGAIVLLRNSTNGNTISGMNVNVHPHDLITADFNLANATTGLWNIVVTNTDGKNVTQENCFEVVMQ